MGFNNLGAETVAQTLAEWRGQSYLRWVARDSPLGAIQERPRDEFSQGVRDAAEQLRVRGGLPPGQP